MSFVTIFQQILEFPFWLCDLLINQEQAAQSPFAEFLGPLIISDFSSIMVRKMIFPVCQDLSLLNKWSIL